uniref:Uncharacterized protein n=1 Tax=Nelumbo nucifera TaxID=4432 RepID=A0A822YYN5_NELNU|nr:TPA_asm: hypothetical protein HUJ06_008288 [Nelumbo nucifera]
MTVTCTKFTPSCYQRKFQKPMLKEMQSLICQTSQAYFFPQTIKLLSSKS